MSPSRRWTRAGAALLLSLTTFAMAAAPVAVPAVRPVPDTPAEILDLVRQWSGVHDTAVQVILDDRSLPSAAADASRLRTVIEPVDLPWLGPAVLYLEETLHDVLAAPRRQVLLRLSSDTQLRPRRIRVRQYTIRDPQQWRGLFADPQAQQALRRTDIATVPGCDLLVSRDGDQFHGGTLGRGCCVAALPAPQRYVDYSLEVGEGVYWFRTRQFRFAGRCAGSGECRLRLAGAASGAAVHLPDPLVEPRPAGGSRAPADGQRGLTRWPC